ncbi:hypothetical protein B0A48_08791 [Cryoendolithus antarcticus]|uniref:RRM domain-containing protein n=1 Tax=Cryoendolithus antarcticus TaxID=1507870 RepID=A0A1V8T465_9PEZI|nr:hypothetical protein B0A48_08791 [Cryoendolithus antarcticus]
MLRRAAVRALSAQPSRHISSIRTTPRVTSSKAAPTPLLRSFHQARTWRAEEDAKREEASPVEASASDETVTTGSSNVDEPSYVPPTGEPAHAEDAVAEASGTTSEPLGQTETPLHAEAAEPTDAAKSGVPSTEQVSAQASTLVERAQESLSSAAETVTETAAAAAATASAAVSSATAAVSNTASAVGTAGSPRQTTVPATKLGDREERPERRDPFTPVPAERSTRQKNSPSRILYIGNLFFEVTAPQLEAEFARFGEVTNSRIVTDNRGLSKGFGYVELATQEGADQAMQNLDQKVFQGRRMAVQYHARHEKRVDGKPRSSAPPSKTLFIGNMSYQMSDRDLNDLFRSIRNVLDVRVAIDRRTGQPRGFAHADFIDVESAVKAKAELESKAVYGRALRIDFSGANAGRDRDGGEDGGVQRRDNRDGGERRERRDFGGERRERRDGDFGGERRERREPRERRSPNPTGGDGEGAPY